MPGFNGTGPRGDGAMTGGGRGTCAPPVGDAFFQRGRGAGVGRALGRRRGGVGMGRRALDGYRAVGMAQVPFSAPAMAVEQELESLRQQAQSIQGELERIQQRMNELDQ